jgi:hypothetical protein
MQSGGYFAAQLNSIVCPRVPHTLHHVLQSLHVDEAFQKRQYGRLSDAFFNPPASPRQHAISRSNPGLASQMVQGRLTSLDLTTFNREWALPRSNKPISKGRDRELWGRLQPPVRMKGVRTSQHLKRDTFPQKIIQSEIQTIKRK